MGIYAVRPRFPAAVVGHGPEAGRPRGHARPGHLGRDRGLAGRLAAGLPLLAGLAGVLLAGLAGVLLAGVLLAERRRLGQLGRSTLFLRVRTWAWIAPVFVLAVFTGGFVVFLLAAAIALQGVAEYARLVELERRYLGLLAAWSLVGLLVAALARRYFLFLPLGLFLLTCLTPILTG